MKILETERLLLRPFTLEDIDDFYEYCSMDTVGPNAGWTVHTDKYESEKILRGFLEKQDVLALIYKPENKVIGSIGLHKKAAEDRGEYYEIGYVLSTPYEGKGLMTEACKRVLQHAFEDLSIKEVYVAHFIENLKSKRVVEKCNFEYIRLIDYETVGYGTKVSRLYKLTKDKYIRTKGN